MSKTGKDWDDAIRKAKGRLRVKTGIVVPSRIVPMAYPSPLLQPPLVRIPRCTTTPACERCHYCRVHRDGERYWEKLGGDR